MNKLNKWLLIISGMMIFWILVLTIPGIIVFMFAYGNLPTEPLLAIATVGLVVLILIGIIRSFNN